MKTAILALAATLVIAATPHKPFKPLGAHSPRALTMTSRARGAINKPPKAKSDNDYLVGLANLSSKTIEYLRTGHGGTWNGWTRVSPIGRNCTSGYSECVKNHNFTALFVIPCTAPPLDVQVATAPDAQGHATGAQFPVNPDCNYAGGVLGLTD